MSSLIRTIPQLTSFMVPAPVLLLTIVGLAGLDNAELKAQVYVRLSGPPNREFQLDGNALIIGQKLSRFLSDSLPDGAECRIWADQPLSVVAANLKISAASCQIAFHNITLIAPPGKPFDFILNLAGRGTRLTGLKIDGNGPAIDAVDGNRNGRGEGIRVVGENCQLIDCQVADLPNGLNANCFFIAGENTTVFRCRGVNPGYACFRNTANHATYDQIESFINRPTANRVNRLFNVDGTLASEGGKVVIRNSWMHAEFDDDSIPAELREVVMVFDPGDEDDKGLDELVIENCLIELGPSVRSVESHHVFKIKNITDSKLHNVTIRTPDDYQGWAMRLQKTQADIEMSCQLTNCTWDQGINFDSELKQINISNCFLGKASAWSNELLNDVNYPETMTIRNCLLFHSDALACFRPEDTNGQLQLENVTFWSNCSSENAYVFRNNVPERASFLTAVNFQFAKLPSAPAQHSIWLSYSPGLRLFLSSHGNEPNTMLFDPRLGVASGPAVSVNATSLPAPPFSDVPGTEGAKIYLADFADPMQWGWRSANYWEWDPKSKKWLPVGSR